ncbi:MAG: polyhydroxyalkanoate synthesis repressor PhaR, partial [Neisseriaceae bacterium]|nr:polyhydroxyalkanoate synthesis repressor PhaR [Neisseriaceae bacterium]
MKSNLRLIKKYPNRRLYDTAISSYVTIADVKQMIIEYEEIQIVDAKTGEDLTRSVFLQILSDEEMGGTPILSNETICQMVRMYGQ